MAVEASRFPAREQPAADWSHPAMAVQLDACIQCNLCVRACREVQVNDVIGMAGRGHHEHIVFDQGDPMGASTCVACGECVQACPTGALLPLSIVDRATGRGDRATDREVDSVCPFCGVGCQLTYHVRDEKIAYVTGRDGPANENRLCVKGRFGFDYAHSPQRLTKPLIRRADAPKTVDPGIDPRNPWTHFREASWDEALEVAARGLATVRDRDGGDALAGFGSAKCSNEEAYLFQKLVRTGFHTNNVDHCTRLCHASSVAALMEGIGTGAVTAPFTDALHADLVVIIGANPTENHPVAATYFKQAAKRGTRLVVMDPRGQAMQRHATWMLQFKPGSDVAMLNAIMHVIVAEGLYDTQYVQAHTEGFERLKAHLADYPPEAMAPLVRHPGRDPARGRPRLRPRRARHGVLGHGRLAARPRHRQCPLPDLAGDDVRPCRPPRHRPAPPARPEQRPGRFRRRPDPDGLPRLPLGRRHHLPHHPGSALGPGARQEAGPDRGRDHRRDPCRPDQGHVRHGREPGHVGPGRAPRPRGPGAASSISSSRTSS